MSRLSNNFVKSMENNRYDGFSCAIATIIALVVLMFFAFGCTPKRIVTTEYKEVPVNVHDTLIQKFLSHDTTIVKDSVFIQQKGDTIFYTKLKDVYKTKIVHDTTTKVVEKPVNVYQTTEKIIPEIIYKQKWWQKVLTWLGGIAAVLLILSRKWGFKK